MGSDLSINDKNALQNNQLQSLRGFSPGYILGKKKKFEQQCADGICNRQALKEVFSCSDREIDILFKFFDHDGNETIDHYEALCALSLVSHATLDEKAELIFFLFDLDKSQQIDKKELTLLMTYVLTALYSVAGKPLPNPVTIQRKTDEFFQQSDTDHDDNISLNEFKTYIRKDKQILSILINFGLANSEDIGMNFGGEGEIPQIDDYLEQECNPKQLGKQSDMREQIKQGIDPVEGERNEFEEEDLQGDEFMAVKPWMGVIKNTVPSTYKPSKADAQAPDAWLELEYVYGVRCHDTRNNVRYSTSGDVVYHTAAVGVVMNTKTNTQNFYKGHNDDIHCLAVDSSGVLCATGQIGPKPMLALWNNQTMQEMWAVQTPQLVKGIAHVAFSKDSKFLAASDMSDTHNIAIFDISKKQPTVLAHVQGPRAVIMSLGFDPAGEILVATCVKEVNFFTRKGNQITTAKGTGWGTQGATTTLCQTFVGTTLYTGAFGGNIISWNGRSVKKMQKAHEKNVLCLYGRENQLISGGQDGLIHIWDCSQGELKTPLKTFDVKLPEIMSMRPEATSVCSQQSKLLVTTRGGEIVEFNEANGGIRLLMRGHFDQELWGLAVHPTKPEIFTFGRDTLLAIWDLKTRRQIKHCKLSCGGDAIAFSNNGDLIVIGFLNGQFLVLDNNFQPITKRCDKRQGKAIQCIKFSPNDSICAIGAHDSMIFTYDVKQKFKPLKKFRGHHSTITHLDFSRDGQFLMSNSLDYEILFWNVSTGQQITSASSFKDEHWDTWSCILGWPVQGIWPPCANGSDINACKRSPDGQYLATGDDFGFVKLFKYPCPVEKANYQKSIGHSSHVTNVDFTRNKTGQSYLVTTGGEEKSVFQWKFCRPNQQQEEPVQQLAVNDADCEQYDGYGDEDDEQEIQKPASAINKDFGDEEQLDGDEALCVQAFKGQVKASTPNNFKVTAAMGKQPDNNLSLKFAHGFRSFDTRGNLRYYDDQKIVFTTAALGVVMDVKTKNQEFFSQHFEDVVSMAINPQERNIVATGQMASKQLNEQSSKGQQGKLVTVFVWDVKTKQVYLKIDKVHRRAVRQLAFSPSGQKLLSIGEDDDHTVAIHNWKTGTVLATAKVDKGPVFFADWKDENEFATCGAKHMIIFTQNGQSLTGRKCAYMTKLPANAMMMTVGYVLGGQLISGTNSGNLITWQGTMMQNTVKAHKGAVWAIERGRQQDRFLTGGADGMVMIWNNKFQVQLKVDLNGKDLINPSIKSLDHRGDNIVLVGTQGADVLEVDIQAGTIQNRITSGHGRPAKKELDDVPEIWGCAVHPDQDLFASCGSDRTVRIWDTLKIVKCSQQFANDPTSIDWSSNGKFIALGDRRGHVSVVDATTLQVLSTGNSSLADKKNAWIEDIKFSPDCSKIALGTHGGLSKIDVFNVDPKGQLKLYSAIDVGISSAVLSLDWTKDSKNIVINSQGDEIIWVNVDAKKSVSASSTVSFEYASWSGRHGFPAQGIYDCPEYSSVKSVTRSNDSQILATGDNRGHVKLFKYPCVVEKAQFKEFNGHSSFVTKVRFSAQDKYLISVGGNDLTVLVWETDIKFNKQTTAQQQIQEDDEQQVDQDDDFCQPKIVSSKLQRKQEKQGEKPKNPQQQVKKQANQDEGEFGAEEINDGDEFGAVKPWIGAMKEPKGYGRGPKNQKLAPNVKVDLEWVHGYRGNRRNNLKLMQNDGLCYYAAGLGVNYNSETHTQTFFSNHTDDVTAIAFSPNLTQVATGELGKNPKVFIWDVVSMKQIYKLLGNGITAGVQALAYTPDGSKLVVIDASDDHNVAIYDAVKGSLIAKQKGRREAIEDAAWQDLDNFITSGPKHFCVWTVSQKSITNKKGNFGTYDQMHGGCVFNGSDCLTGSKAGELYVWKSGSLTKSHKLHALPLDAITVTGQQIYTGGRDCKINVLSIQYAFVFSIDCKAQLTTKFGAIQDSICPQIKAITFKQETNQLIVGTKGSEIWEIQLKGQAALKSDLKVSGHYAPKAQDNNEIWGLSQFTVGKDLYVTASDDGTLRVWDVKERKQVQCINLNQDENGKPFPTDKTQKETRELAYAAQGRSLDISPDGKMIAVGMRDGSVRLYEYPSFKCNVIKNQVKTGSPLSQWIEDIKFSPKGDKLAWGTHNNQSYILDLTTNFKPKQFGKGSSGISHLDWNSKGDSLRTNDLGYELLFYDDQGKQQTSGATDHKDDTWATNTCFITWATQGILGQDGTDTNSVDVSHNEVVDQVRLLATADDDGKVKVYRYPQPQDSGVKFIECKGHSSHVTKVRFNKSDNYIMSTGGNDLTVMQWKIYQ